MRRSIATLAVLAVCASLTVALPALAAPDGARPAAAGAGAQPARSLQAPHFDVEGDNLVRLQVGAFDPLEDALPSPEGIDLVDPSSLVAGEPTYWLVQVASGAFAPAIEAIESAGGDISGSIPERTYLVRATRTQMTGVAASPAVRWAGLFQPAWKVPAATEGAESLLDLDGERTLRVYGFRSDPDIATLAGELAALDGVEVVEDGGEVVDVTATSAQVPAIAALDLVQWVGVRPTVTALNNNARWVSDTGVRDLYHILRKDGLTGEGQTAAVADTGLNYTYDMNGKAHAGFRDCDPYPDDCKLADYTGAGSSVSALEDVTANNTDHRKMSAYFDLGGTGTSPSDLTAHGSHVAGSVTADYGADGQWQETGGDDGMAPAARLVFQAIADENGGLAGLPADDYDLWRQAYRPRDPADVPSSWDPADYDSYVADEDARTHNNSYSLIAPVVDEGSAEALDQFVWDHEDMLIAASAGNSGPDPATMGSPSVAKNDMSSAASDNGRQPGSSIDTLAHFSSHGPTGDGRIGVDVATPGQIVVSAKGGSEDADHYLQGTSMSSPVLTGLATVVRQYFWDGYGPADGRGFPAGTRSPATRRHNPSAALVKAAIINGATRMRGWYTGDEGSVREQDGQYPSYGQGFGLANLDRSLYLDGDATNNWYQDVWRADDEAFAPGVGATRSYDVFVGGDSPFDVSLTWTDAPTGLPAGTPALVNNLDLTVAGPDGTYVGNNFNTRTDPAADEYETPAGQALPDTRNNVERVRVAEPTEGTYTITVRGTAVQQGPQGYALAAHGDIAAAGSQFDGGPVLQQDVQGAPTVSDVTVERYSADTAMVRFTTNEPTTATVTANVRGEEREFVDFYTAPGGDSWFMEYYQPGPVETSEQYENRPVLSTEHEVLVYGTEAGEDYDLTVTATDLSDNATTSDTSFTAPDSAFQPLAPDTGNLAQADTDPVPSFILGGTGWQTMTQLYVGAIGGTGYLGAFMFRLPESVNPGSITGAAVELMGSYEFASRYGPEEQVTVDLLDESVEPNWGTQNYDEIHNAPMDARALPESSILRGGLTKQSFALRCTELDALKQTLRPTDDAGNRNAAFRVDVAGLASGDFAPGFEAGFNRRSRGPHVRPRLVLFTDGQTPESTCDPNTPAPTISDVQVAPTVEQTEETGTVLTNNDVSVYWQTDVASDSTVLFREKGTQDWTQVHNPSLSTLHQIQVNGLDPNADYEFAVRSAACNGETTTDANGGEGYAFFLDPGEPAQPPTAFEQHESTYTFDSDLQGWEVASEGGVTGTGQDQSQWEHKPSNGNPAGSAGVSPYFSQSSTTLTAPTTVQFGAEGSNPTAQVVFDLDIDTEPTFDYLYLDYKQGDGPWTQSASFEGFSGGFEEQVVDLDVDMGADVLVRFRFVADQLIDSTGGYTGVWVDNVRFRTGTGGQPAEDADETNVVPPHPAPGAEGDGLDLSQVETRTEASAEDIAAGTASGCPGLFATIDDAIVREGDDGSTNAIFEVTLSTDTVDAVSVDYATGDGTATAGEDYEETVGTVTFSPGQRSAFVAVPVSGDRDVENDESFSVQLTGGDGVGIRDRGVGVGSIRDDDNACPGARLADRFDDVAGNTHETNILCIAWYTITLGKGDVDGDGNNEYAPAENVSRGQLASFLARMAVEGGLELPSDPPNAFDDDDDSEHHASINALAALGIVRGVGDVDGDGRDEYDPDANVTRAQMAAFIARLHERIAGSLPADPPDAFDDDDDSVHEDDINALAALEVVFGRGDIDGDGNDEFVPRDPVRRDQMASFIARDLTLHVAADRAHQGGADVALDGVEFEPGGTVSGQVTTHKSLDSFTVAGCGLEETSVETGDGGAFEVTLPDDATNRTCVLTFNVVTTRAPITEDDPQPQTATHEFTITVFS